MLYLNQNLFSLDRQNVRENCNLFILLERKVKIISTRYDFFNNLEINYGNFAGLCDEVWRESYNYIVIGMSQDKNTI